jgi:putative effector of murein hydrolase
MKMKGMRDAIATIAWGLILSLINYTVVGFLAHYTKLFPSLPPYVAVTIGFTVAIMSHCDYETVEKDKRED